MVITVTLNPAIDQTLQISDFQVNQVNRVESKRLDVGGKGINVSKSLAQMGVDSIAMGVLGGNSGKWIEQQLTLMNMKCDFVYFNQDTRTNTKIVDLKNSAYTDINEPGMPLEKEILDELEKRLLLNIKPGDVVVLAGKLPPKTDVAIYQKWIGLIKNKGAMAFLDSDGEEFRLGVQAMPTLIKPNEDELGRLVKRKLKTLDEIIQAGKELIQEGIEKVIVSLGEKGALFISKDQVLLGHGLKVKVESTVGAGDAMMAALAYGQEKRLPFEKTAQMAIATSSATIMEKGTQSAKMEKIEALLNQVIVENDSK